MEFRNRLPDHDEIHVWFVDLEASLSSVDECFDSLSADERERASQFRFEGLRRAFTLSRGVLRALLGRYLAIAPDRVAFAYGPGGKPRLDMPASPLDFNLAHSGKVAVFAFGAGGELGADIEAVRPIPDQEGIVRRFFSREEYEEWLAIDVSRRDEAFFFCWTRKEAFIKALGEGLSMPLDSFRVSLRAEERTSLVHSAGHPALARRWQLCSLAPFDGYVCSLAVPGSAHTVSVLPTFTVGNVLELTSGLSSFPPARKESISLPVLLRNP